MKWFRFLSLFLVVIMLLLSSCTVFAKDQDAVSYLSNTYWDSGTAELQVYGADLTQYGIKRDAMVKVILVKEPFDRFKFVKSNDRIHTDVLKMNYIRSVPTGVYDYFQMASIFFDVKTGKMLKFSFGSQDGCGNTYFEIRNRRSGANVTYFSYFDGEGFRRKIMKLKNVTFYDALPVALRFKLGKVDSYNVKLVGSLIANKYVKPQIYNASISSKEAVFTGAEGEIAVYRVTVSFDSKTDVLQFNKEYPHEMVSWERDNFDVLTLKKTMNMKYWEHTANEDRELVEFK